MQAVSRDAMQRTGHGEEWMVEQSTERGRDAGAEQSAEHATDARGDADRDSTAYAPRKYGPAEPVGG